MMELFLAVGASLAVGLIVGILSGMLGIGGGTVLVPVFKLLFGMAPLQSTATSLFTIIPTSISGASTHIRRRTCIVSLGIAAGIGGAIMSPVGVWLASISPEWGTMVAAAIVIGWSAYTMLRKAIAMKPAAASSAPTSASVSSSSVSSSIGADTSPVAQNVSRETNCESSPRGSSMNVKCNLHSDADANVSRETSQRDISVRSEDNQNNEIGLENVSRETSEQNLSVQNVNFALQPEHDQFKADRRTILIAGAIGLGAGVLSGYVGVGGGFIMVPLFMQLLNTPMKLTSGTSLIAVMILAIPGVITQAMLGNVDWLAGIFVSCGTIPGAIIGSRLMARIPERTLRFLFAGFLFVGAAALIIDQLSII